MTAHWSSEAVADVTTLVTKGTTPTTIGGRFTEEGINFIKVESIGEGGEYVRDKFAHIDDESNRLLLRSVLQEGDVLFTIAGAIGRTAVVSQDILPANTNQAVAILRPNPDRIRAKYLYYATRTHDFQAQAIGKIVQTAQANVNLTQLRAVRLLVPPPETQERVSDVLSAYDDLIENNRRRIKLLEGAARLIYREWFVRLRFPGHEHTKIENGVPEGWVKRKIGDYSPFSYGKALKEENRVPGPFPVFGSSGQVGTHEKSLVTGPGIIIGRKGNVGAVYWSDADFFPIDTTYYIDSARASLFLFHALSDVPFINTDVAVPGLNRDMAHSREILIPSDNVLQEFEDLTSTIQRQVRVLQAQVGKLIEARDHLLPRLMSGEIEV